MKSLIIKKKSCMKHLFFSFFFFQKKMDNRDYKDAMEFASDVRMTFTNCYRYNPPEHDVVKMGKKLQVRGNGLCTEPPVMDCVVRNAECVLCV